MFQTIHVVRQSYNTFLCLNNVSQLPHRVGSRITNSPILVTNTNKIMLHVQLFFIILFFFYILFDRCWSNIHWSLILILFIQIRAKCMPPRSYQEMCKNISAQVAWLIPIMVLRALFIMNVWKLTRSSSTAGDQLSSWTIECGPIMQLSIGFLSNFSGVLK